MTTKILLALGAVAFTAMTFNADDVALSPRAAANQIKHVPGTAAVQTAPASSLALSPRAAANRAQTVATVANDVNPAMNCRRHMAVNPKAI